MVILTLTEKGGEPKQLTFEKNEVTVGRVQGNDVVLPKGNVSKRHCRIYVQDGQFSVEDLKSTNGTYINGRKISESTVVSTADKVYVGDFVVRVDNATPAEIPTPPPPAGNEAGSLSTALPRRPPPPPPPRPSAPLRTLEDEGREPPPRTTSTRSSARLTLPPPPPPPPMAPRRDTTGRPQPAFEADQPPSPSSVSPSDIDLDEESLSTPPRLNVPPLKPVPTVSEDGDRNELLTRSRPATVALGPRPSTEYPLWLRKLLEGDRASAVYIASPQSVEVEHQGQRQPVALSPGDADALVDTLRTLAGRGSPRPAPDAPVVNVTLPDGSRLVAVFPPVAAQVCAALHRSVGAHKTLADLVAEGALSKEMQQVLEACSNTRRNVLVSGDRRAAEVVLQALSNTIHSRFRVVVVADRVAPPAGHAAWIKLSADPRNHDLLAAAIALRPDYLIVDIAAASTAGDVLQECAVGQEGVFASLAARSATDALSRLHALAAASLGEGDGVRELIAGSIDLVVHATAVGDKVRVLEIAEPREVDGRLVTETLLAWKADDGRNGHFQTTNAPSRLAATLAARGAQLPGDVLNR